MDVPKSRPLLVSAGFSHPEKRLALACIKGVHISNIFLEYCCTQLPVQPVLHDSGLVVGNGVQHPCQVLGFEEDAPLHTP